MSKKRIYELAKEINKSSKEIVETAQSLGFDVNNHMSSLSESEQQKLRQNLSAQSDHSQSTNKKPADNKQAPKEKKFQSQRNNPKFQNRQKQTTRSGKPAQQNQAATNQGPQDRNPRQAKSQAQATNQPNKPKTQTNDKDKRQRQHASQNRPVNQQQRKASENNSQNRTQKGEAANKSAEKKQPQKAERQQTQKNTNRQGQKVQEDKRRQGNTNEQRKKQNRNDNYNKNNNFNNKNRNKFNKKGKKGKQQQQQSKKPVTQRKYHELPEVLEYTEGMNVADIAKKIRREPAEIIKKLFMVGIMVNQNQPLDKDSIELLAADYGIKAEEKVEVDIADIDKFFDNEEVNEENLESRPPVVTIMGHVDHGKTTLLDNLRHSRVTSGEAGGITQHIGAYQLDIDGKPITFLDTPGHAAFTSMRARGASITDITILVVAADDGVMPQTVEAINHAKAAEIPIIVAVNKVDKPGANTQRVMQELSEYELIPEAWGGDTIFVEISAKFNQNIEELLEMILLVAEVEDLQADPTRRAIGSVVEARLDKGKGPVATLLVQQGTLKVGDPIVVGNTYGRVRVMTNDLGRRDKSAKPATPVEITGLNDVPQAGDRFAVFEDEKTARQAGEERAKRALMEHRATGSNVTLDNLFESLKEGELKEVNVIIKADVQGSAEALSASLQKIEVEGVKINIVHAAVGAINESDITLASASDAIIIGFNVRPTAPARRQAETEEVDIRLHRVIYQAIDEIETAMKGMLDPEYEEKITGQMVVRETYKVSKVGTIAGCYVMEGSIHRDSGVRVIRDGIVVFEGKLASLKRFKDDVKEVKYGYECGATIEKYNDIKVDDIIEGFVMQEVKVN
ncbi:translation initiation factor IF-2 [Tetragenococcus halophilus]|uniref:Translation initiation factor IF-2 n=2 Tax=Tetragenococcus halophilus TaxID=51669 RepID=A0A2H6CQG7_TETHA|nr:translation initiation factor IF-2 [Tetragenococcus halophilus]AOF48727.1 translation initiation factor IF-2 [Tetragenococcus halophilus]AYW50328.1 translation initiation factor IF-2 [Tetragenococcus halophilus]MCF1600791.1 translation initiation factor IF-2 [Tetragenococcus halophilus]MCF1675782.1 translation initiation factor IF-2 [Tetragenococcus halophilus]MCO8285143.1 translation initiation factor IF-2 [Tetragenococcus halophilus]